MLASGRRQLVLDGSCVTGLPNRPISLVELRDILLGPTSSHATRDAALGLVLYNARSGGGDWMVGLGGILLPGLRRSAWPLSKSCPGKAADIESAMLAGLLVAAAKTEPGHPRLAARLTWMSRRPAKELLRAELAEVARPAPTPLPAAPPWPYRHPDLVLHEAVLAGVLLAEDAELISATRIGEADLAHMASSLGLAYGATLQRRYRAERALVAWMRAKSGDGFVGKPAKDPCSSPGGRPRQEKRNDRSPETRHPNHDPRR